MPNTLPVLNAALKTQLRDEDEKVWNTDERDDLLTWSVASLWPRVSRELDPTSATVTLVDGTYYYPLPAGVEAVSRVDWTDAQGEERGPLSGSLWETFAGKLHVSPYLAQQGGTLRLLGYGRYDTSTNPIPDEYVPLVLAMARCEAWRRVAGNRVKYEQWQASNISENVTVADLWRLTAEANAEVERLWRRAVTLRRPVPARHG